MIILSSCSDSKSDVFNLLHRQIQEKKCSNEVLNIILLKSIDCISCEKSTASIFNNPSIIDATIFVCEEMREIEKTYLVKKYPFLNKADIIYSDTLLKRFSVDLPFITSTHLLYEIKTNRILSKNYIRKAIGQVGFKKSIIHCQ
ncbi:MAG: hypothetical protein ACI9XP_000271 [Lentimonas sp.]